MEHAVSRLVDDFESGGLTRRQLVAHLTGLVALAAGAPRAGAAKKREKGPTFQATDVNHLALRVTDVERSRRFYEKHLGLESSGCGGGSCFMYCGNHDFLALFQSEQPGMDHFCFSVPGYDPDDAVAKLQAEGFVPRRGGNRVYFDDPDGLEVQVAAPWG